MEIEIKVQIEHVESLMNFLRKEAVLKYEDRQIDEYYNPAHRDFLSIRPVEEWLRLRNSSGKYSVNYKKWHINPDKTSDHCDEYETKIESIESMKDILNSLNFKHLITVDKTRSAWTYNDYEISIDTVKDLGDFVEIEYKGTNITDPKKITNDMMDFLINLDCEDIKRDFKGYPYLLLEQQGLI
jgi:adenylate cyclase class 2